MLVKTLLAIAALLSTGCGPATFVVGISPGDQRLTTTTLQNDGRFRSRRIAIIDVTGVILNANKPGLIMQGDNPVSDFAEKLQAAANDPRVAAVILRLNTPGGAVTASDAMYREVQRFKEQTGKPVIALMMDVAASGGYYLACSADHIIAYPTTVTGSIGVIVQTLTVKPALDRIGIHAEAMTSGRNKAAGSPLATLTDDHRAVFQKLVDDFYERFIDVVKQARPNIPEEHFADVTDGRVVGGEEAHTLGLVDELGDIHDAFASAKRAANIEHADLVRYHRPLDYVGSPYGHANQQPMTQINLLQMNLDTLGGLDAPAGFYYLWRPDLP